jgi:hypothetical protein
MLSCISMRINGNRRKNFDEYILNYYSFVIQTGLIYLAPRQKVPTSMGAQIFQKFRRYQQILGARKVTSRMFYTEDPHCWSDL